MTRLCLIPGAAAVLLAAGVAFAQQPPTADAPPPAVGSGIQSGPGYGAGYGQAPGYGPGAGYGRGSGAGYGQGPGYGPGAGPGAGMGGGRGMGGDPALRAERMAERVDQRMRMLTARLKLTPAQQTEVRAILTEQMGKGEVGAAFARISAVVDDNQRAELQAMFDEQMARRQQRQAQGGYGPGAGMGGGRGMGGDPALRGERMARMVDQRMRMLTERLNLTPAQQTEVRGILTEQMGKGETGAAFARISAVVDDNQRAELQAMFDEQMARRQQRQPQ